MDRERACALSFPPADCTGAYLCILKLVPSSLLDRLIFFTTRGVQSAQRYRLLLLAEWVAPRDVPLQGTGYSRRKPQRAKRSILACACLVPAIVAAPGRCGVATAVCFGG